MREIYVEMVKREFPLGYNVDDEFLLYDSSTGIPVLQETSRLKCLVLALCTDDEISYTVDTEQYVACAGDILIANEGQVVGDYWARPNTKGVMLIVSNNFFQDIVSGISDLSTLFLFARRHPVFHLEQKLVKELITYSESIKQKINDTSHKFRRELVATILKVLIYDMSNVIYSVQHIQKQGKSRADVIFSEFIKLVEKDFRKQRRLGWYAEQLCITPKYLSETVKGVSKRTPSDWIDYYVMLEIRVMLKNSKMSIKQIAEELNFPNQSSLGKYFKEHYGTSPSHFRRS